MGAEVVSDSLWIVHRFLSKSSCERISDTQLSHSHGKTSTQTFDFIYFFFFAPAIVLLLEQHYIKQTVTGAVESV